MGNSGGAKRSVIIKVRNVVIKVINKDKMNNNQMIVPPLDGEGLTPGQNVLGLAACIIVLVVIAGVGIWRLLVKKTG